MKLLVLTLPFLFACAAGRDASVAKAATDSAAAHTVAVDSASAATIAAGSKSGSAELMKLQNTLDVPIRGLYVNRFAAMSWKKMNKLIAIADSTEVNAFVIDLKDEFGLNFNSSDPLLQKNAGNYDKVRNMKQLVDSIRAHGILPIARIVVFKDSVAARANPEHVIRKADGTPWRDHKGLTWVNPYAKAIWEYNFRVGDEAIKMGFGEIQFDYIRFPEPFKSLPQQVFPESNGRGKTEALAEFLRTAKARYAKMGIRTTADVFGLVTTVPGALEIGQKWEPLAKEVDVMLPMTYPSHYPRGSFNIPVPNAEPRKVQHIAIYRAHQRNNAIGVTGERVRPWIQAFTLGKPRYEAEQITAQKQGIYDAGYDGWVLWHPGSSYDIFVPALEKTLVSRKKNPPVPAQKVTE